MTDHTYKLKYSLTPGHFTKEDAGENDGLADAAIVHSILYPEDGSRSEVIFSLNGEGRALNGVELSKSWFLMAKQLSETADVPAWAKKICAEAFEQSRKRVADAKLGWADSVGAPQ